MKNLVEGLLTLFVALLLFLYLPESPDVPRSLSGLGLVRFSKEEQEVLMMRLDRSNTVRPRGVAIDLATVWRTVSHYRRWPHYVSVMVVFSTFSPLSTYTPSIIK